MSTRYLTRVIAGDPPSVDEWNEHLIEFHRVYSDVTDGWVSLLRTRDGRTSYDVLTEHVKALIPQARNILEIGCGDGALLVRLAKAFGPDVSLTGIDLSGEQVARAAAKLPGAILLRGDASKTDLGGAGQDAVVAHLSLMLMPHADSVIRHAYAALRPSGVLALVVEDPIASDTIVGLMAAANALLRDRLPHFAPQIPGRAPIERDDVLRELLRGVGLKNVSIERFDVRAQLSVEQLWGFVEQTYALGLLDHPLRADLRHLLTDAMSEGLVETRLALRLVSAHV